MQEKRRFPRKASLTKCIVERLFSYDAPVPSRIINYSCTGLMIELDYCLPSGDALSVTISPKAEETHIFGSITCVGMVRWCAQQEGQLGDLYGVGLELAGPHSRAKII
jgi:hypothetical protein